MLTVPLSLLAIAISLFEIEWLMYLVRRGLEEVRALQPMQEPLLFRSRAFAKLVFSLLASGTSSN